VRVNEPLGVRKCIKKNETYRWTLKALGGVSVPRPLQQCRPFGTKIKISALHSKKFQHKPSSGQTMWPCKQASNSNIELTI
jgi:hypothetical protein